MILVMEDVDAAAAAADRGDDEASQLDAVTGVVVVIVF